MQIAIRNAVRREPAGEGAAPPSRAAAVHAEAIKFARVLATHSGRVLLWKLCWSCSTGAGAAPGVCTALPTSRPFLESSNFFETLDLDNDLSYYSIGTTLSR
ncbi:hypothetical protein EMIHUDRAFT_246045 [Emiliania huxleyi CCMP1516]|uniref:Uncharacterized protein n=2 Tax=Emiliania huxleyi TaxID=2903 RepID=A0A0D3IV49_EMIH1|nr:hypothetical protein EMIHUDRAFT_246045 [Emiliania huxleyi CCMP1516]EOD15134.1 hypothetical protein EMIHUDRAFT_246045 [Emiliania huxleyi CCMP1516]|eukprot:XP_005767563.1 hypothetical protein EMIHUDRAFT_246045 [Emiliania huxleyi CCMP1516]